VKAEHAAWTTDRTDREGGREIELAIEKYKCLAPRITPRLRIRPIQFFDWRIAVGILKG